MDDSLIIDNQDEHNPIVCLTEPVINEENQPEPLKMLVDELPLTMQEIIDRELEQEPVKEESSFDCDTFRNLVDLSEAEAKIQRRGDNKFFRSQISHM